MVSAGYMEEGTDVKLTEGDAAHLQDGALLAFLGLLDRSTCRPFSLLPNCSSTHTDIRQLSCGPTTLPPPDQRRRLVDSLNLTTE